MLSRTRESWRRRNARNSGDVCLAAWAGGLINQLVWQDVVLRQEDLLRGRRPSLSSWSWLSFDVPITFEFLLSSGGVGLMVPYFDSVRPHVKPVGTAAFDPNDHIRIQALPPTNA